MHATSHPRYTLLASSFGLGMALLDVTAGNVALPSVQRTLHIDAAGLSWVVDSYTLPFASLLLLSGGLGDRFGAKRLFVAGLAVFTSASALCGWAPTLGWLIAARILQGAGAALFMPSSLALLRRAYPDARERARAIGVWSSLTAVAGASGPLLGGVLIGGFGWRSIFLINVPIGIVGTFLALRFVQPETTPATAKGLDAPAQVAGAAGVAVLTWALIERSAIGAAGFSAALACAALALVAFVWLERRSPQPMLPLRLFRDRTFASTAAAALLYAGAFFGSLFVLSIEYQDVRGDSPAAAGLRIGIMTVAFGISSVLGGRLAARFGTRPPILCGLAILALAQLGLAELSSAPRLAAQAPLLALAGFGAALVAPSMNAAILASVPPAFSAVAGGVLNASRQIGTALGVALFASSFHGRPAAAAVQISLCGGAVFYLLGLLLTAWAAPGVVAAAREAALLEH